MTQAWPHYVFKDALIPQHNCFYK